MKSGRSDIFTLMVDNEFGVLTRITALIRRAGWNIRSLAVAETAVPEISRLTICLECRHNTLESVLDRLRKQSCVREVTLFSPEDQAARELCLVRIDTDDEGIVERLLNRWDAIVISKREGEIVLQICCEPLDTERMLEECRKSGLRDVARTGTIALRLSGGIGGDI